MEPGKATFRPWERLVPNPKLRLREQVAEVCRFRRLSLRTEGTYWQWIRRYILFHGKRHPREMGAAEIRAFLSHLATQERVAASTQNQALNAVVFLYRDVLGVEPGEFGPVERAPVRRRVPVVLSRGGRPPSSGDEGHGRPDDPGAVGEAIAPGCRLLAFTPPSR